MVDIVSTGLRVASVTKDLVVSPAANSSAHSHVQSLGRHKQTVGYINDDLNIDKYI